MTTKVPKTNFIISIQKHFFKTEQRFAMAAGRSEYTQEDDQQIIDYLEKYHNVMSIKGMGIYKNMVAEGIPQNRTHDSVRNRALKSIIRHLHLYKVSNALKAKLLDSNLLRSKNGDLTATSSASHVFAIFLFVCI